MKQQHHHHQQQQRLSSGSSAGPHTPAALHPPAGCSGLISAPRRCPDVTDRRSPPSHLRHTSALGPLMLQASCKRGSCFARFLSGAEQLMGSGVRGQGRLAANRDNRRHVRGQTAALVLMEEVGASPGCVGAARRSAGQRGRAGPITRSPSPSHLLWSSPEAFATTLPNDRAPPPFSDAAGPRGPLSTPPVGAACLLS